ncbi:hypothetical protein L9F63_010967, partial [Diploptera punctata]
VGDPYVDLLLGQPALQDDVVLVVSGGTATLSHTSRSHEERVSLWVHPGQRKWKK